VWAVDLSKRGNRYAVSASSYIRPGTHRSLRTPWGSSDE